MSKRKQFLSVKEVAEILDCGVGPIYEAIDRGHLKAHREEQKWNHHERRFEGTTTPWRIMKKDFRQWLAATSSLESPHARLEHRILKLKRAVFSHRRLETPDWMEAVEGLPPRLRDVVTRRFGLDLNSPATLEDLGNYLGISRERARHLQREALTLLAESTTARMDSPTMRDESRSFAPGSAQPQYRRDGQRSVSLDRDSRSMR